MYDNVNMLYVKVLILNLYKQPQNICYVHILRWKFYMFPTRNLYILHFQMLKAKMNCQIMSDDYVIDVTLQKKMN